MHSFKDFLSVESTDTGERTLESSEEVDEAMTLSQRLKAKQTFKRSKSKIMLGRKKAAKRFASPDKLLKRAEKHARDKMVAKLSNGKSKSDLSYSEREQMEKRLAKKSGAIKKILPAIRKKEKSKFKKSSPASEE